MFHRLPLASGSCPTLPAFLGVVLVWRCLCRQKPPYVAEAGVYILALEVNDHENALALVHRGDVWCIVHHVSGVNTLKDPAGNLRIRAGLGPERRQTCLVFRLTFYVFCQNLADPGIVRVGSGTSLLGPRGRFRAPGRGF